MPQPTEGQRIGNQIDAAFILARADFVNVHFWLPANDCKQIASRLTAIPVNLSVMSDAPRSVAICLLLLVVCFASVALADDFKTIQGKEYKNATISHVEPDGIMIKFSGGLVKIPFTDLPQQVQQRFHYNSREASAYAAEQAASIQQTNQQIEESNKQRREAKQDERRSSSTAEENDEGSPKKIFNVVIVAVVCGIIAVGTFITKFYLT